MRKITVYERSSFLFFSFFFMPHLSDILFSLRIYLNLKISFFLHISQYEVCCIDSGRLLIFEASLNFASCFNTEVSYGINLKFFCFHFSVCLLGVLLKS